MNAPVGSLKPFAIPEGIDPRTWRRAIEKELNALFDKATALITALDIMEADCDLEDTADDEPSIGWTESPSNGGLNDDCEKDDCDLEDSGDEREPSLGWSAATDQCRAIADYGTARDVSFFDGEQDGGDMPEMTMTEDGI